MFNTDSNYFSSINHGLYKHNDPTYQTYYNAKYPHVIDLIAQLNPVEAKITTNLIYSSYSSIYDEDIAGWKDTDDTYTHLIAYNSNQTTGQLQLDLKDDYFEQDAGPLNALVKKVDNQYRINNIRDIAISNYEPIWSSAWTQLQSAPYFYIDKIPNNQNIDYYKSPFESRRFRDYYTGLRFFFTPTQNIKINTDIISTFTANRNR